MTNTEYQNELEKTLKHLMISTIIQSEGDERDITESNLTHYTNYNLDFKEALASITALNARRNAWIIGEDVPIFVDGKQVKKGDPMLIDLSGGVEDARFKESCRNIQENGRNLEKADARKRAAGGKG